MSKTIDINKIAALARLNLDPKAQTAFSEDLQKILALLDELQQVDTKGVEPLAHPLDLTQRLRPDEVTESDKRSVYQSLTSYTSDGLYLVPKVIESE